MTAGTTRSVLLVAAPVQVVLVGAVWVAETERLANAEARRSYSRMTRCVFRLLPFWRSGLFFSAVNGLRSFTSLFSLAGERLTDCTSFLPRISVLRSLMAHTCNDHLMINLVMFPLSRSSSSG